MLDVAGTRAKPATYVMITKEKPAASQRRPHRAPAGTKVVRRAHSRFFLLVTMGSIERHSLEQHWEMSMQHTRIHSTVALPLALSFMLGCSGKDSRDPGDQSTTLTGGIGSTGGGASTTGGTSVVGGTWSTGGGASTTGGTPAVSGGRASTGGKAAATGGASTGGGSAGGADSTAVCGNASLVWKSANKTNYTSYPDPGSDECIQYNGCTWAGQFAACDSTQPEAWVAAHNIVSVFPDFTALKLHDLCLRKGQKLIVVTVLDTCADSDCSGCCTQNKGTADELIDIESYTDARWGVSDGPIEWADLGPTTGQGCN